MGLDIRDLKILRLVKGGVQHAARPHTVKASAGGFVKIVQDVATKKKNAARILKI